LKAPDSLRREFCFHHAKGAAAEIDRCGGESFVHWHQKIAGAKNAALVSESGIDGFTEGDPDVFDGVMLVDVEVAGGSQAKFETAVARHEVKHMVEEPNTSGDCGFASAVEIQANIDLRFLGFALDVSGSKH
jgi:hypothetical protein